MSNLYVMQRANGDVFALDDHGRFRVPLFNSSSDAFLARLHNVGMLLFNPLPLHASLIKHLVPVGGAAKIDSSMVSDQLINLHRGRIVHPDQLTLLMGKRVNLKPDSATGEEPASRSVSPHSERNP